VRPPAPIPRGRQPNQPRGGTRPPEASPELQRTAISEHLLTDRDRVLPLIHRAIAGHGERIEMMRRNHQTDLHGKVIRLERRLTEIEEQAMLRRLHRGLRMQPMQQERLVATIAVTRPRTQLPATKPGAANIAVTACRLRIRQADATGPSSRPRNPQRTPRMTTSVTPLKPISSANKTGTPEPVGPARVTPSFSNAGTTRAKSARTRANSACPSTRGRRQ